MKLRAIISLSVLSAFVWSGCGGDQPGKKSGTDSVDGEPDSFSELWKKGFKGCSMNCHGSATEPDGGPDLSTPELFYQNTVGKTPDASNHTLWNKLPPKCQTLSFVKPGHPEESLIAGVLSQSLGDDVLKKTGCKPSYSNHRAHVPDASIVKMAASWIKKGAKNN